MPSPGSFNKGMGSLQFSYSHHALAYFCAHRKSSCVGEGEGGVKELSLPFYFLCWSP